MRKNYEQPKLELVTLAANDILLTSDPTLVAGGLNDFTGASGEIDWNDIWS